MKNYKVSFFKIDFEKDEKGKNKKTGKENYLGSVVVDDHGTDRNHTIIAKAFRYAPQACLIADKVLLTPCK